ncbi:MAG: riboflavin synthase subunit alpha [Sandaracinaceae bacterium]|jgi:riboflavin synthase|nr:riboflavin synthase subunit alpha [Sandaracinaceae bacterium]MBK6811140.1 riboflavin synthase subunit alpha [Sandaracinaceae bacterium]MBK7151801.1 riboflavin synthase subunit alpha [Sandaracinaceae bacterium]MBK8411456.1 riboflavin synthase subunit alpha [Sandaracinaceae bacterium]MBK8591749.1 riboflavin synthase subunit alpha [Sandaracinaceae bacterium]
MYSGITRGLFPVVQVSRAPGLLSYSVDLGAELSAGLALGASVAIDGVCQTVASLDGTRVGFDAIQETLNLTTLDTLEVGRLVSVERSLRVGDELGGHEVAGHVVGRGEIAEVRLEGHDVAMRVRVPEAFMPYILPKGFIAVDGSSLTVGRTYPDGFTLHLIPETLRLTNFGSRHVGDLVNIELDPRTVAIVHTVERVLAQRLATQASP